MNLTALPVIASWAKRLYKLGQIIAEGEMSSVMFMIGNVHLNSAARELQDSRHSRNINARVESAASKASVAWEALSDFTQEELTFWQEFFGKGRSKEESINSTQKAAESSAIVAVCAKYTKEKSDYVDLWVARCGREVDHYRSISYVEGRSFRTPYGGAVIDHGHDSPEAIEMDGAFKNLKEALGSSRLQRSDLMKWRFQ
jgi:hypothetical protein